MKLKNYDILSDISLRTLNKYFFLLCDEQTRSSQSSYPLRRKKSSLKVVSEPSVRDASKTAHMRDIFGLVPRENDSTFESHGPIVWLDHLDINLLSEREKKTIKKLLHDIQKKLIESHGEVDLFSDFGWKYIKHNLPKKLVYAHEKQSLIAKHEQNCRTNISYSELSDTQSPGFKKANNHKRTYENETIISRASLKKSNLTPEDAKDLIKQAKACRLKIDRPPINGNLL